MTDRPEDKIEITSEDLAEEEPPRPPAGPPRLEISSEDLWDVPDEPARAFPGLPPGGYPGAPPGAYPGLPPGSPFAQPFPMAKPGTGAGLSNVMRLGLAGAAGGLLGWLLTEHFFNERTITEGNALLAMGLWFALICLCIGAAFGIAEGVATRVWQKVLAQGGIGAITGFIGGFFGGLIAQGLYANLAAGLPEKVIFASPAFYRLMLARSLGWAVAGCFAGLGQGVAIRAWRKVVYGMLGGLAGGFVGGMLFDPIAYFVGGHTGAMSRAIGITVIGGLAGLAIGLVEEIRKQGWLLVLSGLLTGKQFILYKEQTALGSSPKCDIVLPKDAAVQPQHALIRAERDRYLLQDLTGTPTTLLNGQPVTGRVLRDGDTIQIGGTGLAFRTVAVTKEQ